MTLNHVHPVAADRVGSFCVLPPGDESAEQSVCIAISSWGQRLLRSEARRRIQLRLQYRSANKQYIRVYLFSFHEVTHLQLIRHYYYISAIENQFHSFQHLLCSVSKLNPRWLYHLRFLRHLQLCRHSHFPILR